MRILARSSLLAPPDGRRYRCDDVQRSAAQCPHSEARIGPRETKHENFQIASGELDTQGFMQFLEQFLRAATSHLKDGAILQICMDWKH
ncbi:hypothetical protein ACX0MU_22395 [Rhizorhabdus wittichii]